ncbi:MAG: D-alanyl-D-alanine carboxypeptidase [Clostridia bacterium]|nr:D-alanyl-D-alanine carboxypeptidase [Clostridia bacterium]
MNTDSRNTRDTAVAAPTPPTDRTHTTVTDILARWPLKKHTYTVQSALCGYILVLITLLAAILIAASVLFISAREVFFDFPASPSTEESGGGVANHDGERPFADGASGNVLLPWAENVKIIPADSIHSSYAALADLATGEIIASRKADEIIYPASMTKVMTLIVVVENLPGEDCLQDVIEVSSEVYEEMKRQESSGIGMEIGEKMTVESMLYALMLKSDGIAACELARYVAGSEEDFVELMNQKAEKMGLTNTHFENPTGLFHENHKTTSREIASIMAYAMNMKLCRKILMTQSYTAPFTTPAGEAKNYYLYHNLIVTQFDNISPNQPNAVTVAAGKTGFTDESKFCLVTYAESADGHGYVCVTARSGSYAECIADYLTVYNTYIKP